MRNNVAIIDLDSVIFTAFHPNKVLNSNGTPIRTDDNSKFVYKEKTPLEIMQSCDELMKTILNNSESTHYIAFVKGKNTVWRRNFNPEYKADRGLISPKLWNFTKEYLKLNWSAIEVDNIETDDAVNITRLNVENSFICAIDSDLLGLEGTHYNWRTNKWIVTTSSQAELKFWSDMIVGTHNNTKGIPGRGEKYFEKIVTNYYLGRNSIKEIIFNEYINHFGEYNGIKEFYKNYISLKLLDSYEGFETPKLIEFDRNKEW